MRSTYQVDMVPLVELPDNVGTKHIGDTSIVVTPALDVDLRVRPEQVAQQTCVRHILRTILLVDHVQLVEVGAESTVHTEDLVVDDGANWKHIEAEAELFPDLNVVPSLALIIKSIHSVDRLALVVASQKIEMLRVLDFVGQQKDDGLDALLSSVNVVSYEEELLVTRGETSYVE